MGLSNVIRLVDEIEDGLYQAMEYLADASPQHAVPPPSERVVNFLESASEEPPWRRGSSQAPASASSSSNLLAAPCTPPRNRRQAVVASPVGIYLQASPIPPAALPHDEDTENEEAMWNSHDVHDDNSGSPEGAYLQRSPSPTTHPTALQNEDIPDGSQYDESWHDGSWNEARWGEGKSGWSSSTPLWGPSLEEHGQWHWKGQVWRSGKDGGKARYGNPGGRRREWMHGFYKAKGRGKAAREAYLREHPYQA